MSQAQTQVGPWIIRVGPPMWIIMPEHYVSPPFGGVNEPKNDSIGPGSSDQTKAPRNSNNHIGEKYINVRAGRSLTPP